MRRPIASDKFYVSDPVKLYEQVSSLLINAKKQDVKIAIAPHAGYDYSGKCAGEVYSRFELFLIKDVETIILLGPNHSGIGPKVSLSHQSFLTPFGKAEIDLDLMKLIKRNSDLEEISVYENEEAHNNEHSLEVQLPFIQTVFGNDIKIVPMIFKDMSYEECLIFSKILFNAIVESGRKVRIIVSSDFTHHGYFYDFVKFKENVREELFNLDMKSINFILNFDSLAFYEYAVKETTICGIFAITIGIELAKLFSCAHSEKVSYYNSGDVSKDYENSVNYAGIIFY